LIISVVAGWLLLVSVGILVAGSAGVTVAEGQSFDDIRSERDDFDELDYRAFPRSFDLGEPDMHLSDVGLGNDTWFVYGIDPSRDSPDASSLDYKIAMHCSLGGSDYYVPYCYSRVLLRRFGYERRVSSFTVNYLGERFDFLSFFGPDIYYKVTGLDFAGVGLLSVGDDVWIDGELSDDYIIDNFFASDLDLSVLPYSTEDTVMMVSDGCIFYLYDINIEPTLPSFLFEP
jgi:hypothetical protein